jgi:site-specific DNA recombinase
MQGTGIQHSRAVILARVSSKAQGDEGYSLDSQLKLLRGYCDKHGLEVVKKFKVAETASKEQSRKIFHEMLVYLGKQKIYHLAVEKTDRFTRNFRDAVAIDEWLDKDEARRLHAVKENLTLHKNAKSDVKFMWNIHLSVAKKYTDNLREEAMKGWAEKLAQG